MDPDPVGSETFCWIRKKSFRTGIRGSSGSVDKKRSVKLIKCTVIQHNAQLKKIKLFIKVTVRYKYGIRNNSCRIRNHLSRTRIHSLDIVYRTFFIPIFVKRIPPSSRYDVLAELCGWSADGNQVCEPCSYCRSWWQYLGSVSRLHGKFDAVLRIRNRIQIR